MPIFEYTCQSCQHPFEAIVSRSEQPACPKCESDAVEKRLSVFAVGGAESAPAEMPSGCQGCPGVGTPGCGLN